jgi:hypothetical protein
METFCRGDVLSGDVLYGRDHLIHNRNRRMGSSVIELLDNNPSYLLLISLFLARDYLIYTRNRRVGAHMLVLLIIDPIISYLYLFSWPGII